MTIASAKTTGEGLGEMPSRIVDGARQFEVVAKRTRFEVTPGRFYDAYSYNDRVPGPVIRVMTGKIALAHLRELPDYYTRLAAMESQAGS